MGAKEEKPIHSNIIVGIGGISRSGKSSLARELGEYYACPTISVDDYIMGPLMEKDEKIDPAAFSHWESNIGCAAEVFYKDLKELALKPNKANLVVVEGYLLYNRPDVVNLLDIRIMRSMTKEGAYERLKKLRPRLIKNKEWYDKIMWDLFLKQNWLFNEKLQNSYDISGELDPVPVKEKVIKIIDEFRASHNTGVYSSLIPRPINVEEIKKSQKLEKVECYICNAQRKGEEVNLYTHSCGNFFHAQCFKDNYKQYMESMLKIRKPGETVNPLLCPKCNKEYSDDVIQEFVNLNDYVKAVRTDHTCYQCNTCESLFWGCRGYDIVYWQCTKCFGKNGTPPEQKA